MAPLLRNQTVQLLGRLILGGLFATGVVAGGIRLSEFTSSGNESTTATYVAKDFVNVFCTGTGGNVKVNGGAKYNACIVANPLAGLLPSLGSGTVVRVALHMGNNPASASFDCGFVKSTTAGTGTQIFDNKLLGTGSVAIFGTGALAWNGADYIKCATLTQPYGANASATSFTARLRIEYEDIYGE